MIAALRTQIIASAENAVNLIQFFEACPSRHAMIVAFLAVLEMVKLQAVALVQEKQFGDILLRKHKMFDLVFDEAGGVKLIGEGNKKKAKEGKNEKARGSQKFEKVGARSGFFLSSFTSGASL